MHVLSRDENEDDDENEDKGSVRETCADKDEGGDEDAHEDEYEDDDEDVEILNEYEDENGMGITVVHMGRKMIMKMKMRNEM